MNDAQEKIRILLVDDEQDFRTTLATRLRLRNLDVTEKKSGEMAILAMGEQSFDVVVLDIRMPGMDGIDTLRHMKSIQPTTEVILLTGHASVESGIDGMQLGALDYLIKPCDIAELVLKIESAHQQKLRFKSPSPSNDHG
ncbi:MAG: response regulator [Proteobacteria bacterium]|nr:response regulator [Desulfobulbaceae bacterium]MBU4154130.1 response regulator [Pseudomonadota bacterium]MDP2105666.1 response regulator [Desulfobulbaceae bacterium]